MGRKRSVVKLLNKVCVTTAVGRVAIDAQVVLRADKYVVTCHQRHAKLMEDAEKVCWRPRTMYSDEEIELCVINGVSCGLDYLDFVCVVLNDRSRRTLDVVRGVKADEKIDVYLFGVGVGKWALICESRFVGLMRAGKLLDSKEGLEWCLTSESRCFGKYARFACVPKSQIAQQPLVHLSVESTPEVQVELHKYDIKLSDTLSYRQFINGEVDLGSQSSARHIVLSGSGDHVATLADCEDKIVRMAVGLTVSYRCVLQKCIRKDCGNGKKSWALTLEVLEV